MAAPWRTEQVLRTNYALNPAMRAISGETVAATNLFPDPSLDGGAAQWSMSGGTVADGPEGGIKVTSTGTGYALATSISDALSGLAGLTTLYVSADIRVTGTSPTVAVQVATFDAAGTGLGNKTQYLVAPPVGAWTRMTFTLTLAAGTDHTSNFQLTRGSGGAAGDTTEWRNIRASATDGPFFSGDTPADGTYFHRWTGTPNASTSQKVALLVANARTAVAQALSSTDWAVSGAKSMRLTSLYSGPGSGYCDVARNESAYTFDPWFKPGTTYTALVTSRTDKVATTTPTGGSLSFTAAGVSVVDTAPNVPGTHEHRITFTTPASPGFRLRLYNNAAKGDRDVWFDNLLLVEGEYDGPYFDGNTAPTGEPGSVEEIRYRWTGLPDVSSSEQYAPLIMDRPWAEGDFELDGYRFGGDLDPVVVTGWDTGTVSWNTQDANNPVSGGVLFGRDKPAARTWTFDIVTNQLDAETALAEIGNLATAWRAADVASTPGATSTLRYRIGGRVRRVYGRPRRFSSPFDYRTYQGMASALADFDIVDSFTYDDASRTVQVGLVNTSNFGIGSPLVGPLTTTAGGARSGVISGVGGEVPAPFVAVINGPITNPWISGPDWRIEFRLTLASDQFITIDTRPWALTCLRNDGASVAGTLTRESSLIDARLAPGSVELKFGGIDATGTATCVCEWRPTHNSH